MRKPMTRTRTITIIIIIMAVGVGATTLLLKPGRKLKKMDMVITEVMATGDTATAEVTGDMATAEVMVDMVTVDVAAITHPKIN
ncbi:hypothetical protein NAB79_19635 [Proteus mirabilis]|nr:hypothetical protein [Proteus mirabilis]